MKHLQFLIVMSIILFGMNSCSRTYTSATSIVPTSQAPVSHKEKGDFSIKASYESHDVQDQTNLINTYFFLPVKGVDLDFSGAISDNLSIGLGYQASWSNPL